MIIKGGKNKKSHFFILIPILLALLLAANFLVDSKEEKTSSTLQDSMNRKTNLVKEKSLLQLIADSASVVISGSNLDIHLVEEFGLNKIYYIYKGKLSERQMSDRFYLHVFLKDSSELYAAEYGNDFINLDFFDQEAIQIEQDSVRYYLFSRSLLIRESIPIGINDISYIETGRYSAELGRSEAYKLDTLVNLNIAKLNSSSLKTYCLFVDAKAFKKLQLKREEAISNGVLITGDNDYVKGKLSDCISDEHRVSFRLKGDWTDHLEHESKWSFRVVNEDGNTFNGMRKFSFQHPRTRFYLWEWLFHRVIKSEELIGLRYDFCNLILKLETKDSVAIKRLGIMAIEESFDKLLIEDNKRRAGVIIGLDESFLWNRRAKQNHLGIGRVDETDFVDKAPIKVYNQNKVLSDTNLLRQFKIAKGLLNGLRKGELEISEAFDLDKLTTFTAISNLFGALHGLHEHNIRMYYNPITSKLEPIAFDAGGGHRVSNITHYPFAANDTEYQRLLLEKLKYYSRESFIEKMISVNAEQLQKLAFDLNLEFDGVALQTEILSYNSNFIKSVLNPADALLAGLVEKANDELILEIQNLTDFQIRLIELKHLDGKRLDLGIDSNIIEGDKKSHVNIELKPSFVNAFVSKKNKVGSFRYPKDVAKLVLIYELVGVGQMREVKIMPYVSDVKDSVFVVSHKKRFKTNVEDFEFISTYQDSLVFKSGSYAIKKSIIIADNTKIHVEAGFELDLLKHSSIISFSAVNFNGSASKPIKIYSSNSSGGGLFVSNAKGISRIDHSHFNGLSNPNQGGWEVSGTVNFHESDVIISNSFFSDNGSEDFINIVRSEFSLSNSTVTNSKSDAFDGDFVDGTISDCLFINSGNDAIDVSGSSLFLENIMIENSADKAISAGEKSNINGNNIKVRSGEIGIVSKDLSIIDLSKIEVVDTRLGVAVFQKKPEFGAGEVYLEKGTFVNTEKAYLIEVGSVFMLNEQLIPSKEKNVSDRLYGNNYGKSTK